MVIVAVAVMGPLLHTAMHVMETEAVRSKAPYLDGFQPVFSLAAAFMSVSLVTVEIGLIRCNSLASRKGCRRYCPCCVRGQRSDICSSLLTAFASRAPTHSYRPSRIRREII